MNDAQQQTSAFVDGNDSDVDSDDDVPMGLWRLWSQPALGTAVECWRGLFCVMYVVFLCSL